MDLKDRIKEVRGIISQITFANQMGVDVTTIQKYESGKSIPTGTILQRIHQKTGVNLHWLLTGEGVPYYKGIEGSVRTADGKGLWGKIKQHEIEGKKVDVTLFSPDSHSSAARVPPDFPLEDPFLRGVGALRTIFDSGDSLLITAIQANLTAFEQAAQNKRHLQQQSIRIQTLEKECEILKQEISDLKIFCDKLCKVGDAGAGIDKTGTDTAE